MLLSAPPDGIVETLKSLIPTGVTTAVVLVVLFAVRFALVRARSSPSKNFRTHAIMLAMSIAGLAIIALTLSNVFELQDEMVQVIGAIVVGTIGLSSTTILGNALAGVQNRVVGAYKTGDFLRVGEHFGRVTETGLFHTEIQTEDRDLTTLPNLFLVSNPYRVLRASGTIISATVSLGYDVPRALAQDRLLVAAQEAELEEPFVQLTELGDFSVEYRVAGLFTNVKHVLTCRSNLRKHMLDALHGAGIEIMSPTYMTTRAQQPDAAVMPAHTAPLHETDTPAPESIIFDKAEEAESREKLRGDLERAGEELRASEAELAAAGPEDKAALGRAVAERTRRRDRLAALVAEFESAGDGDGER